MSTTDFEKYDGLDAPDALEFLLGVEDPAELRTLIAHEKRNKDRSTVITDEVIEKALAPSEEAAADPADLSTGELLGELAGRIGNSIEEATEEERQEAVAFYTDLGKALAEHDLISEGEEKPVSTDDDLTRETIAALLEERRGYEQRGDDEKIKAVNAELKRLGHKGKAPGKRAATR
jgi:hypothetical protein